MKFDLSGPKNHIKNLRRLLRENVGKRPSIKRELKDYTKLLAAYERLNALL
jgi:hypothetical protein